jgi:hypothetical protein
LPGYIKLYRDLQFNKIWQEKPFTRGQAWVDMLLRCNHVCLQMPPQYQSIWVLRGQFLLSNLKLAEAWGWDEKKVRRFMGYLEKENMIRYYANNKFCVYEIIKYAELQALDTELFQAANAEQKPNKSRTKAEQKPTYNNGNNGKNEKKYINIGSKLETALDDFKEYRKKSRKPMTEKAVELLIEKLNKLASDDETKIAILNQSIVNGWQGIFPLKDEKSPGKFKPPQAGNFEQRKYTDEDFDNIYYKV